MKLSYPTERPHFEAVEGSWFPFGVGIDCHKDMVWVSILRPDYETNKQSRWTAKFLTTPQQLSQMRLWMEGIVPQAHRRLLLESTSTYHFPVMLALRGWQITTINPALAAGNNKKTDRWDAQKLAHHSMAGTFPVYLQPTVLEEAIRVVYRRWLKIGRGITRNTNALRSRMCRFGVHINATPGSPSGWGKFCRICRCEAHDSDFGELAGSDVRAYQGLLAKVPRLVRDANARQLREISFLDSQRLGLWNELVAATPARTLALLRSIPHIAETTALCFVAECGLLPRRRFRSLQSLVAYAGFDPTKRVSADKVTSFVSAAGNKLVRRSFLQAAQGAMHSKTSPIGRRGQQIRDRVGKRGWWAGVNAIGRVLVRYCGSVLNSGKEFVYGEIAEGEPRRAPQPDEEFHGGADGPHGGEPAPGVRHYPLEGEEIWEERAWGMDYLRGGSPWFGGQDGDSPGERPRLNTTEGRLCDHSLLLEQER